MSVTSETTPPPTDPGQYPEEVRQRYERHAAAVVLEVVQRLDHEVNEYQYRAKKRRDQKNKSLPPNLRIMVAGGERSDFLNVPLDKAMHAVVDEIGRLGMEPEFGETPEEERLWDAWLDALDDYLEPIVEATIDAVSRFGDNAKPAAGGQSSADERDRLRRDHERRTAPVATEIVGEHALREALALIDEQASRGRLVLAEEWTALTGSTDWEDAVRPLQAAGWLRIVRVRDLRPGQRSGLPTDAWAFVWERERLPVDLWRAFEAVEETVEWRTRAFLLERQGMPAEQIAADAAELVGKGVTKRQVLYWQDKLDVPKLPPGRPAE